MVVTRRREKKSITPAVDDGGSPITGEENINKKADDSLPKTHSNGNMKTTAGKKKDSKLNRTKVQQKHEDSTPLTEKQSVKKGRRKKIINDIELDLESPCIDTTLEIRVEERVAADQIQTKGVSENSENKSESSELLLSEYSSEEESDQTGSRKRKKISFESKVSKQNSKQAEHNEESPSVSNTIPTLETNNTELFRKSPRAKAKIKYIESESEDETKKKVTKKSSDLKEDSYLSDSSSEASEPESGSDSSVSSNGPEMKRKRMLPKSKIKAVRPQSRASSDSGSYKKDTRRRVDLSEMDAPEGKDSVLEKMKQRQFDGIVRYFFGGGGAKDVQVNPDLLQKKLEKKNKSDKISVPSTSSAATTESVKEKQENENNSSSESEWEEVSDAGEPMDIENYNPEIPKEGIEINLSVPDHRREKRRKKRQAEFANYARQFLNRFKKDTQVAMHKVHLLGYVAHMLYFNRILLDSMFQGLALSLLPSDFLGITTKKTTQILLTKMVTWYRNTFTLEPKENKLGLVPSLTESLQTKIVSNPENYCYLFVIFGRAMRLDVRLCRVAYPITFKAHDLIPTDRQKQKTSDVKSTSDNNEEITAEKREKNSEKNKAKSKKMKLDKGEPSTSNERKSKGKLKEKEGEDISNSNKKTKKRSRVSKKNVSYKEDESEGENSGSDDDFEPEKNFAVRKSSSTSTKKNRKILSSDSEDENAKRDGRPSIDIWAEVFLNNEGKWVCVDVVENIVNRPYEIEANLSRKFNYVLTVDNESKVKDVTQRYASGWLTDVRKHRVDSEWWEESLAPFAPALVKREKDENRQLNDMLLNKPMPTTIGEFKNHPLYVLKRHLLKYEGLYPPDIPPLGFIRKEPVYARECVRLLHSRETWKREGKAIKLGEEPYKLVKARPRWDKVNKRIYTPEEPLDVYGEWQTAPWVSPPCQDGKVPRNEYGNVELFKPSMLPEGAVHLRLPGLNRIARKLGIDCAPAMVGFDGSASIGVIPVFDGFVACEEYEEVLVAAWNEEQVNIAAREKEKYEKRVYGNWRKLIRGLLIREKIKSRYFGDEASDTKSESSKKKK